jgi:heavy metal sensor kinase
MTWWAAAPIRLRLTLWYAAVLSLVLAVYATAAYVMVRHEFREQLEESEAAHGIDAGAEQHLDRQLGEILFVLTVGFPLTVLLAGAGGYVLAGRALAPIDHLAAEAKRITAERLHARLTVPNAHDEIGRLAAVINDTYARLESSFDQLRRFTSDASHELRTPLSVMRGIGELSLGETRPAGEYREALSSILEETDRLTRLVDTLLRLSRADAGSIELSRVVIDAAQLARDVASSLMPLAEERGQRLTVEGGAVPVSCDPFVIREALTNVVDNAIKYSPAQSTITLRVGRNGDHARVSVADQGAGIDRQHHDRIFDRFYRIDEGRSRDGGGAGLGLAIAKWAVEANGGQIGLESSDRGSVFHITLPLVHRSEGAST